MNLLLVRPLPALAALIWGAAEIVALARSRWRLRQQGRHRADPRPGA